MNPVFPRNLSTLSKRRQKLLTAILPRVIPSKYPEVKFKSIIGWANLDNLASYSTCGNLMGYVGIMLGVKARAWGGVEGLRTTAKKADAWVDAGSPCGPAEPKIPVPGDLYGLCETPGGVLKHVGVIVDPTGNQWVTADAGQAPGGKGADYVVRAFDRKAGTLTGEVSYQGTRNPRPIAGWLDLDAYPFPH